LIQGNNTQTTPVKRILRQCILTGEGCDSHFKTVAVAMNIWPLFLIFAPQKMAGHQHSTFKIQHLKY
jgi:hypothetical protein